MKTFDPEVRDALQELVPTPRRGDDWELVLSDALGTGSVDSSRPRSHAFRRRRAVVALAGVAIVGVLLATPAFGVRERIVQLLGGEPAPGPVKTQAAQVAPGIVPDSLRGLMRLTSSQKVVATLYAAETTAGRACTYAVLMRLDASGDEPPIARDLVCMRPGYLPSEIELRRLEADVQGRTVQIAFGTAPGKIVSLDLQLSDRRHLTLPVARGRFLFELPKGGVGLTLIGHSANGEEVARLTISGADSRGTNRSGTAPLVAAQQDSPITEALRNAVEKAEEAPGSPLAADAASRIAHLFTPVDPELPAFFTAPTSDGGTCLLTSDLLIASCLTSEASVQGTLTIIDDSEGDYEPPLLYGQLKNDVRSVRVVVEKNEYLAGLSEGFYWLELPPGTTTSSVQRVEFVLNDGREVVRYQAA